MSKICALIRLNSFFDLQVHLVLDLSATAGTVDQLVSDFSTGDCDILSGQEEENLSDTDPEDEWESVAI